MPECEECVFYGRWWPGRRHSSADFSFNERYLCREHLYWAFYDLFPVLRDMGLLDAEV